MLSSMKLSIPLDDEETKALFAECEPGETLTFTVTANNGTSLDGELEKSDDYEEEAPEPEAAPAPMAKKMPKALVVAIGK